MWMCDIHADSRRNATFRDSVHDMSEVNIWSDIRSKDVCLQLEDEKKDQGF